MAKRVIKSILSSAETSWVKTLACIAARIKRLGHVKRCFHLWAIFRNLGRGSRKLKADVHALSPTTHFLRAVNPKP